MGGEELRKNMKNPFLHNKKELDEVAEGLKNDPVGLFYFLKRVYVDAFGDLDWEMWDGGDPPIDERNDMLRKALVDGRKIPEKYFPKPHPKEIF